MGQDLADSLVYLNAQDASNYSALDAKVTAKLVEPWRVAQFGTVGAPLNDLSPGSASERVFLASPTFENVAENDLYMVDAIFNAYWTGGATYSASLMSVIPSFYWFCPGLSPFAPFESMVPDGFDTSVVFQMALSFAIVATAADANPASFDFRIWNKNPTVALKIVSYTARITRFASMYQ
jgi:hypothetical protein